MALLSKADQEYFYGLIESRSGINKRSLIEMFGYFHGTGAKFKTTDRIILEQKRIAIPIIEGTQTTIGKFIVNKFLFEDLKIFGYIQKPLTGGIVKKIDKCLADALLLNNITTLQWHQYIDRTQWLFGGALCDLINPSTSLEIMKLPPKAKKRRNELFKEHAAELDSGNAVIASKIEKEVCDIAIEEMRATGDSAVDIFDAQCGIDVYNNYKTMFVMKGAIQDSNSKQTKYNIVKSSLDEGIKKDEFPYIADSITLGAFSKGKLTGVSGYEAKKYDTLFKEVVIKPGTDCGSKEYFTILLTKELTDAFIYMNIMDGNSMVTLTMANIDSFIGKEIQVRHPSHCKMEPPHFCEKCFGIIPAELEINNIGLWAKRIANSQLNANMKKFHDITIKLYQIQMSDILGNFKG